MASDAITLDDLWMDSGVMPPYQGCAAYAFVGAVKKGCPVRHHHSVRETLGDDEWTDIKKIEAAWDSAEIALLDWFNDCYAERLARKVAEAAL